MNTRHPIESYNPPVALSVSFNSDSSCFAVGLDDGFCIFNSTTLSLSSSREFNGGLGLVQMMGKTNFLALVGGGRRPKFAPNKVILWDDAKGKVALEISSMTSVRGVRLARNRIVVVLQNSVRVYSFAKTPDLLARYETADNPLGLCDLSERHIAFPGRTSGQVQLVEISSGNVSIIPAHSAALVAMRFSPDGSLLATASEKGTIIRVFATNNCARVAELRRGWDPATIFSLGFSPSGVMLACTSDKGTLHVYDVPHPNQSGSGSSAAGGGDNAAGAAAAGAPSSPRSPRFGPGASTASLISASAAGPAGGSSSGVGGSTQEVDAAGSGSNKGKWGILGKIPLMPRYFSDVVSFAQVNFASGDEPANGPGGPVIMGVGGSSGGGGSTSSSQVMTSSASDAGLGTARPPKGIIGWVAEDCLLVVGAGRDARYERFIITRGQDGRRMCMREGWKRYLGSY